MTFGGGYGILCIEIREKTLSKQLTPVYLEKVSNTMKRKIQINKETEAVEYIRYGVEVSYVLYDRKDSTIRTEVTTHFSCDDLSSVITETKNWYLKNTNEKVIDVKKRKIVNIKTFDFSQLENLEALRTSEIYVDEMN